MKKRIIALLLCAVMVLSLVPSPALAAESPALTIGTVSGYRGSTLTLNITAEGLQDLGALTMDIFYDSEAFTVVSADKGQLLGSSMFSVNTAESGVVTMNAASADGISGSGTLLTLRLQVKQSAVEKSYAIHGAVTECYTTALQSAFVGVQGGSVTVKAGSPSASRFNISCAADKTTLHAGDTWKLTVSNNNWSSFASGVFTVEYDPAMFAVESAEMSPGLLQEDGAASINTQLTGLVVISYARSTNTSNRDLFSVTFRTLADTSGQTAVKVLARSVLQENHTAMADGDATCKLILEQKQPALPALRLGEAPAELKTGDTFTTTLTLDAGSAVAAGDFTLTYDPNFLLCTGVEVSDQVAQSGGTLVASDMFGEGLIRFSYVNEKGWSEEDLELLTLTWKVVGQTAGETVITPGGTGVVDSKYAPVALEYPVTTVTIRDAHVHSFGSWFIETESVLNGNPGTKYRFCACGEKETATYSNPLTDVPNGKYFTKPIFWAYENGITKGKTATEFQRDVSCTRKQIVTFLWRAAGQPEPKSMVNPFTDVKRGDQFEKAILWAYYEGITSGTGDGTTFSPENACTRKQIVTFLWRFYGQPAPESEEIRFTDVKNDRFAPAILWAAEQGITTGTGDGSTFSPEDTCTRGQIVTFLYRAMVG